MTLKNSDRLLNHCWIPDEIHRLLLEISFQFLCVFQNLLKIEGFLFSHSLAIQIVLKHFKQLIFFMIIKINK